MVQECKLDILNFSAPFAFPSSFKVLLQPFLNPHTPSHPPSAKPSSLAYQHVFKDRVQHYAVRRWHP